MEISYEMSKEYLNDTYKFEIENAKIIAIENFPKDDKSYALIFDKTIFHPQGGGQPSDEGEIICKSKNKSLVFQVIGYDREREVVLHKILKEIFENSDLKIGDLIDMKINEEKRRLHARLHSAGHLLDITIGKLGLNLIPGKGYHFPDGPYVEYNGNIDKKEIDNLSKKIEEISNEIILNTNEEDVAISNFYSYDDGKKKFANIPSYLPENRPFRWVKLLSKDIGCPCSGTHVQHVKDINKMKISKITNKGKIVRISYNVI